ncbi:OpgC domain-containing protein [Chelativorans sp. AA-79]|uniref:OpgC family protein n=1 Tax=Chelativorans sp. AA-79 TaxID=3028735 RepID=UPI0023F83464|nr:OpgC domain-containing protein [Chelativorans sp. AA-79]WEX10959.1 OpgC domain-containing protein [Chelativorans sp. AA-79]
MRRLEILDGMRGYFLVFMMLNHLTFTGGYLLVKFNHGELGYVQDAQGFVFLSGLLVGMVYARRMLKEGYAAGAHKIRKRAMEIYRYAAGSILAIIALGLVLTRSSVYWEPWLWKLSSHDPFYAIASLLLLYQPTYMDILPQYVLYMLVSPPLIWLCVTGRWKWVAVSSVVVWIAAQLGLHLPLGNGVHSVMEWIHEGEMFRSAFNVLGWQIVFMSGLVLGALSATKEIDWKQVITPEKTALVWAALALVLIFMTIRFGFTFGFLPEAVAERFTGLDNRVEFSFVYLVNFMATGYLVAWMIMAGSVSDNRAVRILGKGLRRIFSLSLLRLIGRHSLQVYAWHVIVVYLLKGLEYHNGPFTEWTKTIIALLAVGSLAIPALYRERMSILGKYPLLARARQAGR